MERMKSRSLTTTDIDPTFRRLPPLHVGEVLREEFLVPLKLSPYALAKALGVPRTCVERLATEETALTADTALRLARYLGTTAEFWMSLQAGYELECAKRALASKLGKITPRSSRASRLGHGRRARAA
ncbi:MAG: HigA family addiction module antitoxin [Xanthobacteraceae bacterium]|jgi:addiction module HigA family antidote